MKVFGVLLAVVVLVGGAFGAAWVLGQPDEEAPKVQRVFGAKIEGPLSGAVEDDLLETKVRRPLEFDLEMTLPERVNGLEINNSEAVLEIDLDPVDPSKESVFAKLYPSYQAARDAAVTLGPDKSNMLVSSSMVYSMTRDFDHGLVVMAETALARGNTDRGVGIVPMLKTYFERLPKTSIARPYVAAALEVAGEKVEVFPEEITRKNIWLSRFRSQTLAVAPPLDYYTWTDETRKLYEFIRFVQDEFPNQQFATVFEIAKHFRENPDLLVQYEMIAQMFQLLSRNRREFLVLDFTEVDPGDENQTKKVLEQHQDFIHRLQFIPETSRREIIHFQEYLPMGCTRELNPFAELIQRSMIGFVTILPRDGQDPGVEQVQAMALDCFLSETRGPESEKTLLTRIFRERAIRPFYAEEIETTDPSTVRPWKAWEGSDTDRVCPQLRVEPVPMLYIRLARNYRYIGDTMRTILGENTYQEARRLTPEGEYAKDPMPVEIERMMNLMYGLYFVCCEDLGVRPLIGSQDSGVDRELCYQLALEWLPTAFDTPDAARDARFSTIVHFRPFTREVVAWGAIGVRLQKMLVSYARRPQARAAEEGPLWVPLEENELGTSRYVLPVLELAGIDMRARFGIDPAQFREICDKNPDRESILEAVYALEPPTSGMAIRQEESSQGEAASGSQPPKQEPGSITTLPGLPDPTRASNRVVEEGIGIVP